MFVGGESSLLPEFDEYEANCPGKMEDDQIHRINGRIDFVRGFSGIRGGVAEVKRADRNSSTRYGGERGSRACDKKQNPRLFLLVFLFGVEIESGEEDGVWNKAGGIELGVYSLDTLVKGKKKYEKMERIRGEERNERERGREGEKGRDGEEWLKGWGVCRWRRRSSRRRIGIRVLEF
jgi:hypothetical protein